jgi:hypothetical protein
LSPARFLSSDLATCHGAQAVSVVANISSRARVRSGARVIMPSRIGFEIHFAKLPNLTAVADPRLQAPCLLVLAHLEPVFEQHYARANHRLLDERRAIEKDLAIFLRAKARYALDASAIVPAAVENHDFGRGRRMEQTSLHVHLRFFTFCGRGQRHAPKRAGLTRSVIALMTSPLPAPSQDGRAKESLPHRALGDIPPNE